MSELMDALRNFVKIQKEHAAHFAIHGPNPIHPMRITQPNSWSCTACVAAMATGTTLWDVIKFIGHDGSAIVEDSLHPEKRRGFYMQEILAYMLSHDLYMGFYCSFEGPMNFKEPKVLEIGVRMDRPAMFTIGCSEEERKGGHVLYWDGAMAHDPNPEGREGAPLKDFALLEWWPIIKFEK